MPDDVDVVFVSHANPEDNLFAGWLSSKLTVAGYNVWCDLRSFQGGEKDFWNEVERTIRRQTRIFICLVSSISIKKPGTMRELAIADGAGKGESFVVGVRTDKIDFKKELPAELIRSLLIDGSTDWGDTLFKIVSLLQKQKVPCSSGTIHRATQFWLDGHRVLAQSLTDKQERHWSNWFRAELPNYLFVTRTGDSQKQQSGSSFAVPISGYSFRLFLPEIPASRPSGLDGIDMSQEILARSHHATSRKSLPINQAHGVDFRVMRQAIVRLMNIAFESFLSQKGLRTYELSGGRRVFFIFLNEIRRE